MVLGTLPRRVASGGAFSKGGRMPKKIVPQSDRVYALLKFLVGLCILAALVFWLHTWITHRFGPVP